MQTRRNNLVSQEPLQVTVSGCLTIVQAVSLASRPERALAWQNSDAMDQLLQAVELAGNAEL